MRKFIIALVLMVAVAFVFLRISEFKNIVEILHHSNYRFLVAAFLIECIWFYNSATNYAVLYRLMGLKEKASHLMLVATAANFINTIVPSVNISGMAVFVDDAGRQGHPTGRVTVVGVLYVLFDYMAFLFILGLGFIVLIRRNNINIGEIIASVILLAIAVGFAFLLYLGYRSATRLGKALVWLTRLVNRILRPFMHREYLKEENAYRFALEAAAGIEMLRGKRKEFIWPFLFALNNFALLIVVLAFTFLALGTPFSVGTLVGGFAISYLFLIVSPTPSGVGVVEGVMVLALNSLRVQFEAATLITLTYRLVTFWFPMAVGALAFRYLGSQKHPPSTDSEIQTSHSS